MSTIRAIYFDAVGTLIHPEPSVAVIYAEAARRFGSRYDAGAILQRFRNAIQTQEALDHANDWTTNEDREKSRWRQIVADVLDDATDPGGCFDFLYRHFAAPEAWRCDAEADAAIDELASHGYALGLASNFDGRLVDIIRGLTPLQRLPNVVISSVIGHRKPAGAFYQFMCRQVGLDARQILYVGDDLVNDYAGAQTAGMHALLYDPLGRHAGQSMRRIRSLGEVLSALGERGAIR